MYIRILGIAAVKLNNAENAFHELCSALNTMYKQSTDNTEKRLTSLFGIHYLHLLHKTFIY